MNLLIFYVVISVTFHAVTCEQSEFYTAGVVEFRPVVSGMSSADMLNEHLNAYLEIITSNKAALTDIIIFPEGTLNNILQPTYVPNPETVSMAPCDAAGKDSYADFFVTLSCTARTVKKYLMINLTEQENCPATPSDTRPCAANGLNVYNTNVVFNRDGVVVSRYRKVHTYKEMRNTTLLPEHAIFDTDFGVRFGHFICFDIIFYTPAMELVKHYGVDNIIFTSLFYSELPFLTAVQLQQSWAYANNVNLLAAGASYPQTATTGSGIYAGTTGQLISLMTDKQSGGKREILVARVPKYTNRTQSEEYVFCNNTSTTRVDPTDLPLMPDPQIENFVSILLAPNETTMMINETLCHGDHCCHFKVEFETSSPTATGPFYRIGVFNGQRTYEEIEVSNLKVCAIYVCLNSSTNSCSLAPSSPMNDINFQILEISGSFPNTERLLLMPNSLSSNLQPLCPTYFRWHYDNENNSDIININLELSPPTNQLTLELLTFAIYGNYYDQSVAMPPLTTLPTLSSSDPPDPTTDSSNKMYLKVSILTASLLYILFCNENKYV